MLKVGQVVKILSPRQNEREDGAYSTYKVIQILDKEGYHMYLCENVKTKVKCAITDQDVSSSLNSRKKPLVIL